MPIWFYRFEELLEEMIGERNLSGRQIHILRRKAARKVRLEVD